MKNLTKKLKEKWVYIIAFILPWLLVIIHSVVRDSWLSGEGSILSGDAGNVYYQLYVELWNRIHEGKTLFFSWNAGNGTDFLVNMFRYLMSPFTLFVLIVPKSFIADAVQIIMVLKWSCLAVSMVYYFQHTRFNTIKTHKRIISLVVAFMVCFSNMIIFSLEHMGWLDVFILFPFLLLFVEQMTEGKGFRRFYVGLTLCLLFNFSMTIPLSIFLIFWFVMIVDRRAEDARKHIIQFVLLLVMAYISALVVILPCLCAFENNKYLYLNGSLSEYMARLSFTFSEFVQRFFVCDHLSYAAATEPMLYCSVVAVAIAMLYVFIPMRRKKKIINIGILILLLAGLFYGGVNLLWHGYVGIGEDVNSFSYLLIFMLAFMAMEVLANLDEIKIWQVLIVLGTGIVCVIYTFFNITAYLDFYVYLGSLLLFVFMLLMVFFYCRKSIKYKNILVLFTGLCISELLINAYYQFDNYNMYRMKEIYYHAPVDVLSDNLELQSGGRIAITQNEANYGMVQDIPTVSAELMFTNGKMQELYRNLGLGWNERSYDFFGGSPVLNQMFFIEYGMSTSAVAFSENTEFKESDGFYLYKMDRSSALGYMVNEDITDWNVGLNSPFDVQNDFVEKATGGEGVFEVITPEVECRSLLGGGREYGDPDHLEGEEEEEDNLHLEEIDYSCEYNTELNRYSYHFIKMYFEDYVTMSFESDGISDYYIFVESNADAYHAVLIDGELVYTDQLENRQKTFHIGVVESGKTIAIQSDVMLDDIADATLRYQIAAWKEENFDIFYNELSQSFYQITDMKDDWITGEIDAKVSGIMMTGIPALEGYSVYVDEEEATPVVIGNALLGIPMAEGKHTITIQYKTVGLNIGLLISCIGILLFLVYCRKGEKSEKGYSDTQE